jgi:hypothetical protein
VSLNPQYAGALLEVSCKQILLNLSREYRERCEDQREKIFYGQQACFYSEGSVDDVKALAAVYQLNNEEALAQALLQAVSQEGLPNYRAPKSIIEKNYEMEKNMDKDANQKNEVINAPIKWKKEDIRDIPDMPEQERDCLAEKLNNISCFLEYGSGGSTVLASSYNIPNIYSVDSDKLFLEAVVEKIKCTQYLGNINSCWVDIGPTGHYGNPIDFTKAVKWPNYCIEPWKKILRQKHEPSLILVDGRFRVACFLASLFFAKPGTTILFDDYAERGNYHVVEKHLKPKRIIGRMGEFIIEESIMYKSMLLDLIANASSHG